MILHYYAAVVTNLATELANWHQADTEIIVFTSFRQETVVL